MLLADLNSLLGMGTLALQIGTALLFAIYFFPKQIPGADAVGRFLGTWGILIALAAASAGSAFAVIHSSLYGLEPCPLCYWQRIFLFPQIVLFVMVLWKREYRATVIDASIVLSSIGGAIAIYHHILQMFPGSGIPCPATGPSCSQILFLEMGYITYPMMALTLFVSLSVLMLFVRKIDR